jgi:hypothetical protein
MMRAHRLLLAFALPALAPTGAAAAPPDGPGPAAGPSAGAPAAAPTLREAAAQLDALGPAERAQAAASLRYLTAHCPYTRAAMLLAVVLHDALEPLPAAAVAPASRAELAALQADLDRQLRALDGLGLQLGAPAPGEALHGQRGAAVPTLAELRVAPDPVAAMGASIAAVPSIAAGVDAPTRAQIEAHSARLEALTGVARPCPRGPWSVMPGQPWTLGLQLHEAQRALERLAPAAVDPAARAELHALIGLIGALGAASEASWSRAAG